jgi:hypothetical protein
MSNFADKIKREPHIQFQCLDGGDVTRRILQNTLTFGGTGFAMNNLVFWFPEVAVSRAKVLQIVRDDPEIVKFEYKNTSPLGKSILGFERGPGGNQLI